MQRHCIMIIIIIIVSSSSSSPLLLCVAGRCRSWSCVVRPHAFVVHQRRLTGSQPAGRTDRARARARPRARPASPGPTPARPPVTFLPHWPLRTDHRSLRPSIRWRHSTTTTRNSREITRDCSDDKQCSVYRCGVYAWKEVRRTRL